MNMKIKYHQLAVDSHSFKSINHLKLYLAAQEMEDACYRLHSSIEITEAFLATTAKLRRNTNGDH